MLAVSKIHKSVDFIPFPEFRAERIYMIPFVKGDGLPDQYARWQPTVDSMMKDVPDDKVGHLMVDGVVTASGYPSRRPGIHVDGYWDAGLGVHRGGGGHRGVHREEGGHGRGQAHCLFPEAIILASNVQGCVAYEGAYLLPTQFNGGDCSKIETTSLRAVPLESHTAYVGHSMFLLHASVPVAQDSNRVVVRINIPGWLPAN
jgi:hypothetical protein